MQDIDDFPVDAAWDEVELSPELLSLLWGAFGEGEFASLLTEHGKTCFTYLKCKLTDIPTFGFDAEFFGEFL
jgi:hypothetical protein